MKMKKMRQQKICLIAISMLLFVTCSNKRADTQESAQEGPVQIKVAAYNVEYSKKGSAREIGEALKPYQFDIVCFSEAPGGSWTKEVGAVMGLDHVVVGKYSTAGHDDKFKTIASRTPLTNYEEVLMANKIVAVNCRFVKKTKATDVMMRVYYPLIN